MTISLLLSFLLFFIPQSSRAQTWLDGQWVGTGYQSNNGHTWSIRFTADTEKQIYTIEYPSLNCGGEWELLEYENGRAVFREVIREGYLSCVTYGRVVVTWVGQDYLSFSWFEPYDGSLGAWSTLVRKEAL